MYDYDDAQTNYQSTPPPPPTPPTPPTNKDQKAAIAAAGVGVTALGGAAWGMSQFLSDDNQANNNSPDDDTKPEPDPNGVESQAGNGHPTADSGLTPPVELAQQTGDQTQLISTVNREDMTFADAFREARQEMGPNHYFEWHGHLYNTFYTEEWNQMSHEQQQTFLASVPHDDFPVGNTGGMLAGGEIPTPAAHHASQHAAVVVVDDVPDPVDNADVLVEDNSVHTATNVTVDHAPVTPASDVDVAVVDLEGHEVMVFDVDNDDRPDALFFAETNVVLLDTDHDHILDTKAVYDTDSHKLTDMHAMDDRISLDGSMTTLHQAEDHTDATFAANMDFDTDLGSDFDPNADISDYA
ncbi:hypothetical protein [uncultured Spirosoma sp.]|uniref:hypothetical protein n=1 Tax=uncultured Spirosoma sp. TaxID=278208 RepID=UPI00258F513C|nr:hypothetical protein [uncultured Spirosoma sp.]